MQSSIEIMDTTLRDGEQMQSVSYSAEEKLSVAKILLSEVKVNRLEITSAGVSAGEKESVRGIVAWATDANLVDRLEVLSFVDSNRSVDWVKSVGIKRVNLLTKGSLNHCVGQLRKSPQEHANDIVNTILYAAENQVAVNVYLEDFSNGIKNSPDYVHHLIDVLLSLPIERILLPDTLGIFNPFEVYDSISALVKKYPYVHFEFHPHNDYGLGTANALAAVRAGVKGVHTTVNGMGERAGNAPLDEIVVGLKDFLGVHLSVDETKLYKISQYVEMFSGHRMANNKPIYGKNVFTQTAGIHADGDKKGNLYANPLVPERFGRKKEYALGKLSGRANLELTLKEMEIELDDVKKQVLLQKIIALGDKKEVITKEDLPFLISDVFGTPKEVPFVLLQCSITSTYPLKSFAAIQCAYHEETAEAYAYGNGGYDAFMRALQDILHKFDIPIPQLLDYTVTIPPGGKTDALVQAAITWQIVRQGETRTITTRGVNSDQNRAAIEATVKMINYLVNQDI